MRMKSLAAFAAATLVAPPLAAAAPVPAPIAQRANEVVTEASRLEGTTAWILAAIALGLIVWGIIELSGDDGPSSP